MILEVKGDKLLIDLQALDIQWELTRSPISPTKFSTVITGGTTKEEGNKFGNMTSVVVMDLAVQYLIGSYELLIAGIRDYIDRSQIYVDVEVTEMGYRPILEVYSSKFVNKPQVVLCEGVLIHEEDERSMGYVLAEKKVNINRFRMLAVKRDNHPLIMHYTQSRPGFVTRGRRILIWSFSEEVDYLEVTWEDIDFDLIREIDQSAHILT